MKQSKHTKYSNFYQEKKKIWLKKKWQCKGKELNKIQQFCEVCLVLFRKYNNFLCVLSCVTDVKKMFILSTWYVLLKNCEDLLIILYILTGCFVIINVKLSFKKYFIINPYTLRITSMKFSLYSIIKNWKCDNSSSLQKKSGGNS